MKKFFYKLKLIFTFLIIIQILFAITGCLPSDNADGRKEIQNSENQNSLDIGNDRQEKSEKEANNLPPDEYDLPIIMYHSVLPKGKTAYTMSPDMLETDFKYIQEKGYHTVTVNEVIAFTEGKGTLPEKPIMLTFDDGYYNNFVYVIPLLEKYDFKCVTAIVGSFSNSKDNREGKPQSLSYSHMNKYQIKEAVKSGRVEIQHHSYSLHSYGKARKGIRIMKGESYENYKELLVKDTLKLNEWLLENCEVTPTAYFYPFGAWCKEGYEILKELGFKATLGVEAGLNKIKVGRELKNLYRYNRAGNISTNRFFEKNNII